MTEDDRRAVLSSYLDGEIAAERAADLLGDRTSVAEVVLETRALFGRLPDRSGAFVDGEHRRGLALLGLDPTAAA